MIHLKWYFNWQVSLSRPVTLHSNFNIILFLCPGGARKYPCSEYFRVRNKRTVWNNGTGGTICQKKIMVRSVISIRVEKFWISPLQYSLYFNTYPRISNSNVFWRMKFLLKLINILDLINVRSEIRAIRVGNYARINKRTVYVYFGL